MVTVTVSSLIVKLIIYYKIPRMIFCSIMLITVIVRILAS